MTEDDTMNAQLQQQSEKDSLAYRMAKLIRILTLPPIMVGTILLLLCTRNDVYATPADFLLTFLGLSVIPVLSYPVQMVVPSLRRGGRKTQRSLAFVFSFFGYALALLSAWMRSAQANLVYVTAVYSLSLIFLTAINCLTPFHASGHACSLMGPLVLAGCFIGRVTVLPSIILYVVSLAAALYMRRHTLSEFLLGSLSSLLAAVLCAVLLHPTF